MIRNSVGIHKQDGIPIKKKQEVLTQNNQRRFSAREFV